LWEFKPQLGPITTYCCGPNNRGVAVYENMVYVATLDAKLYGLDAKTGAVRWTATIADPEKGYSETMAPTAVNGKILIGTNGGEYGIRGFLDAYDADTGRRVWRFYTIPGEGERGNDTWQGDSWKRGGAPTWVTGAYDPELNTLYWGTGNPGPQMYGANRAGDNLYSDSLLALDPDTGTLKWHFQFTPHDVWDFDGNLADRSGRGNEAFATAPAYAPGHRGQGLQCGDGNAIVPDTPELRAAPGLRPCPLRGPARSWLTTLGSTPNADDRLSWSAQCAETRNPNGTIGSRRDIWGESGAGAGSHCNWRAGRRPRGSHRTAMP